MGEIKTKDEIKLLKKSADIANSCIPLIEKSLKENVTERELKRRVEQKIKSMHAKPSFRTLVACGKRSAIVHPKPCATDKRIYGIGYVDFGASFREYKSDVTVPFIKGDISKKEMNIVQTTLQSYKLAIKSIAVNMLCLKPYEKVDKFLREKKYKMLHSLGHGLGKKIHELPYIGKPNKKMNKKQKKKWEKLKRIKFQENMIFTIEPGVYVKGIGGCRLENDVWLTNKGSKILTKAKLIKV
jgi:Xaa-Pro aminopeptidase